MRLFVFCLLPFALLPCCLRGDPVNFSFCCLVSCRIRLSWQENARFFSLSVFFRFGFSGLRVLVSGQLFKAWAAVGQICMRDFSLSFASLAFHDLVGYM